MPVIFRNTSALGVPLFLHILGENQKLQAFTDQTNPGQIDQGEIERALRQPYPDDKLRIASI